MALPASFLDELRARTPMAALVSRGVKLSRSGKSWKGCCPFHGEKTPSFYVYDDGYHCFGCGAHGDAIAFVMNGQGASFIEAVEMLAAEAGLDVPKPTPAAAEAEQQRLDLTGVLDLAATIFRRQLHAPGGTAALGYLRGRGLTDDTIARFGLGWSGEGRGALIAEMVRDGVDAARMAEAGLLQAREGDAAPRELFYNRVIFPIRDRRGRVISFGGRALGDTKPKYINGPESPVFSKGRSLYALDLAREPARRQPVVVAEGYMDVIALHQAGFAAAVAPLGTALTAAQLEELWRLTPTPVLCFDGDGAGARAAARAAETALPLLRPDRTLRLAALPSGEDPDTLLRRGGQTAFQTVLDSARPLATALYDLLAEGVAPNSPEARTALRARLVAAADRIPDKALASEYRVALLDRFFAARRRKGVSAPVQLRSGRPTPATVATADERARNVLAILLVHPGLLADVEEAFAALTLPIALLPLREAMLHWWDAAEALDSASLMNHLQCSGLDREVQRVLADQPIPLTACARPGAMPAEAEAGWWHFFQLLRRDQIERERTTANHEFSRTGDPAKLELAVGLHRALVKLLSAGDDEPD